MSGAGTIPPGEHDVVVIGVDRIHSKKKGPPQLAITFKEAEGERTIRMCQALVASMGWLIETDVSDVAARCWVDARFLRKRVDDQ